MAALTADRDTHAREGETFEYDCAASVKHFAGGLAMLDASGNCTPGAVATGQVAAGRVEEQTDNSSGSAGDITVKVRKGVFKFVNDGTNTIAKAHIGDNCYIEDDQTVSTNSTGTSIAGKVMAVDSDGVWVKID